MGTREVPRARGDWIEDVQPRAGSAGARAALASPRFRKRDGEVIAPPPYEATCPNLLMFVLRADKSALQSVCDTHLGASYQPLGDYVVLYATTISTTSTGITCTANEVGVWMPLMTAERSLRTYSPYIWLDSATSTVSARGIFGYAKHTANVDVPPKDQLARGIKITGDALVSSTGTQLWCTSREVLLTATPDSHAEGTLDALHEIGALATKLGSVLGEHPTDLLNLVKGMRSVFLKQIPAAAGLEASYQKLVEAPDRAVSEYDPRRAARRLDAEVPGAPRAQCRRHARPYRRRGIRSGHDEAHQCREAAGRDVDEVPRETIDPGNEV